MALSKPSVARAPLPSCFALEREISPRLFFTLHFLLCILPFEQNPNILTLCHKNDIIYLVPISEPNLKELIMSQNKPPLRRWAGVFDFPVEGENTTHGVDPSSDAIEGYYGLGWHEYFRDARTGEVYRVRCSDGVNGGKGAYSDDDARWRNAIYNAIVARCHEAARDGATEIRISRNERAVMQGFTHAVWLESSERAADGKQSNDGLEGGLVGHCLGVPVVCDLDLKDNLPPQPQLQPQPA